MIDTSRPLTGGPAGARPATGRRRAPYAALEWAAVLLAPAVAFFALRVRPIGPSDMIDPYLYSGIAQNGARVVERFGNSRSWVRLGMNAPAHLSFVLFGPLGGFYVFRYVLLLLAVVPAYVLFRRLAGRGAGAVAVAAILATPVTWQTLASDYPDSAAYSYLLAGTVLLVTAATTSRWRRTLVFTAGVLLSLAVHSQAVAAPVVAAIVLGYAVVHVVGVAREWRRLATDLALLMAAAAVTTLAAMALSKVWGGYWNIFDPTLHDMKRLRTPTQIKRWHSDNNAWVVTVPYLLLPPAVLGAFGVLALSRRRLSRPEVAIGIASGVAVAVAVIEQFWLRVASLEFHYWSSMLWPGITLTLVIVVVHACRELLTSARTSWIPATMVGAVSLVWSLVTPHIAIRLWPWPVEVAVGLVAAAAVALRLPRRRVSTVCTAVLLIAAMVLVGSVSARRKLPNQSGVPVGSYYAVFGHPSTRLVDIYEITGKVQMLIPAPRFRGERIVFWWIGTGAPLFNQVSAGYGWHHLGNYLPATSAPGSPWANGVLRFNPGVMVLLSHTGDDFAVMLDRLGQAGLGPRVVSTGAVSSGTVGLRIKIVRFDALDGR